MLLGATADAFFVLHATLMNGPLIALHALMRDWQSAALCVV
jgi:hypothetical protein